MNEKKTTTLMNARTEETSKELITLNQINKEKNFEETEISSTTSTAPLNRTSQTPPQTPLESYILKNGPGYLSPGKRLMVIKIINAQCDQNSI